MSDGRTVTGTEFERMAGRAAAKKWKVGAWDACGGLCGGGAYVCMRV